MRPNPNSTNPAVEEPLGACLAACESTPTCGGFSFKLRAGEGENASAAAPPLSPLGAGNCSGAVGTTCCYMQRAKAIGSRCGRAHPARAPAAGHARLH